MDCQVTEKMKRMGSKAGLTLRGFKRAGAQPPRLLKPAK
jgi:hypothetical protein